MDREGGVDILLAKSLTPTVRRLTQSTGRLDGRGHWDAIYLAIEPKKCGKEYGHQEKHW